ncbi:MAG: PH domain-containing protein [Burkholderiaceae bacterium]|nr:PH domain-containing protein [Burkholderiaceae bacterium]
MVFRSKVDAWLVLVLVAAAVVALAAAGAAFRQTSGMALLAPVAVVAIGAALPIWILVSTAYVVESRTLHIRSGPFSWRIPVSSITSIKPSRSPISSPTLSLKRLRVEYGTGKSILVSPADQQAFMHAIEGAKNAG